MNPFAELLTSAAAGAPRSVVSDRRVAITLSDAMRRADDLAARTLRTSPRSDPVVTVVLPSTVDAVVQLLAAVLGDYTVCFVDPSSAPARRDAIVAAVDPDVLVDASGTSLRQRLRGESWGAGYVAMSSGSTGGAPKAVLTSWTSLADFAPHGAAALMLDAASRWAEPTHPAYDMAMTNWAVTLAAGASLHVTGALADRLRPLGLAARVGATHVRLAPRYIDLAAGEHASGTAATLRVWGSGGDRLSPGDAHRLFELGVPTLINTYGSSETAGFASAARLGVDDLDAVHGTVTVGSGLLGPWRVELATGQAAGQTMEMLAVRTPHLARGYLFGGEGQDYPRWESDRVVTGDMGAWVGGRLFCFGRAGRLVKRSASFVNLDEVDLAILDARGLATYTVVTRGGALVTLVEGMLHDAATIRSLLGRVVPPDVVPDVLVPVPRLPRLENGKADQAAALTIAEMAATQGVGSSSPCLAAGEFRGTAHRNHA